MFKAVSSTPFVFQQPPDSKKNKAKRCVISALFGVLSVPMVFVSAPARLYTFVKNRSAIERLAEKRYDAACSALDLEAKLSPDITQIQALLETRPKGSMHDHMQKVRSKIDRALAKSPQGLDATFLHHAAHVMTVCADGMEVFQEYGEKAMGEDSGEFPLVRLAFSLDRAVKKKPFFKKDTVLGKIFWTFAHPEKATNSFFDHVGWSHPLAYNSYQHGNANVRIGAFEVNGSKIHMILGPTPTCDRLFVGHLQHLKETGMGVHAQHTLESPWQKAENVRRIEQQRVAEHFKDEVVYTFGHIENKGGRPHLREEGVALPKNFTKAQAEGINTLAEEMFGSDELSDKARRLGLQTLVAIQGIFNLPKGEHSMGQACKQDIDRGVLVNVLTILFMDQLANQPLTDERIAQILGIVLLRPGLVDDRAILKKRYDALSELVHFIAKKPEVFDSMKRHFLGSVWYKPFAPKVLPLKKN